MEISILFNHIGLYFLFAIFIFIATAITTFYSKKAKAQVREMEIQKQKEREWELEKQRIITEAALKTFSGVNSDDYFKYYEAQNIAKTALKKASKVD